MGFFCPCCCAFPQGQLCKLHSTTWELLAAPVPAQGTARVGEVLRSSISCCSLCAASAQSKGQPGSAALVTSVPLLFPPSLLRRRVRGCCCGKERVEGKVRCFGQGGKRLALTGWVRGVCSVCPWKGGSKGTGAHAG